MSTKETMAAILILENRAVDRTFLATLLKSAGHAVNEASDGAEGLRLAELSPHDLVISDILMPTVDSYEFVRRLRSLPGSTYTPAHFYTATSHQGELIGQRIEILVRPASPSALTSGSNS